MKLKMAYVLAILAMVTLGIGNFIFKISTDTIGPIYTTLFYYVFGTFIGMSFWWFSEQKSAFQISTQWSGLIWPALAALSIALSVLSFSTALKSLPVSLASTILNLSFIVTTILGLMILKESLSLKDIVAILLAVTSIVIFGLGK
ncbi:EamA family transporter [Synechococcus sp. PCC 7336]|uniref:EamA family transporter n=1 Tax=Synechococcus sp. PCC 7336 TaxID=195250 RepID=UPI0012EA19A2|nr:EamA family transporter [Synechococcus sp. PCC 7336]